MHQVFYIFTGLFDFFYERNLIIIIRAFYQSPYRLRHLLFHILLDRIYPVAIGFVSRPAECAIDLKTYNPSVGHTIPNHIGSIFILAYKIPDGPGINGIEVTTARI